MRRWSRVLLLAVLLAAALFVVASAGITPAPSAKPCHHKCPPPPPPAADCSTKSGPPATYAHVIWIWMENHSYNQIIGSSAAPYINSLAQRCGLATNYTALTHPSLPNYIAATSGGTQGISDGNPPSSHPLAVNSIFQQAGSAGSYEESMPTNCDLSDASPTRSGKTRRRTTRTSARPATRTTCRWGRRRAAPSRVR